MIALENGPHGTYIIRNDDGRDLLVQVDYDFCGIASTFGWMKLISEACEHVHTDGTVDCRDCSLKVSDFIASAREFLDEHIGDQVEDPGYFTEGEG